MNSTNTAHASTPLFVAARDARSEYLNRSQPHAYRLGAMAWCLAFRSAAFAACGDDVLAESWGEQAIIYAKLAKMEGAEIADYTAA